MGKRPNCRKCGRSDFRRIGLIPTNTNASGKGWRGKNHKYYKPEAIVRLYSKRYACKRCGTKMNYGNAGRPIT